MDDLDGLDTREWLLTNGLGGFASGTVCDAHTRTYHGWLIAALDPPSDRTMLLSHVEASLQVAGETIELGTNLWISGAVSPRGDRLLRAFKTDPLPTWHWGVKDQWQLSRRLILPYGLQSPDPQAPQHNNRVLIHYRYEGQHAAVLTLRPLIADRNFHHQQRAEPDLRFSQVLEPNCLLLQATRLDWVGTSWQIGWTQGDYHTEGMWYWGYHYPEETRRGLADHEDLYSPGLLTIELQPGETVTLEARVRSTERSPSCPVLNAHTFDRALQTEQQRLTEAFAAVSPSRSHLWQRLLQAGDQFIAYRASINGPTVIAGYPWFNDWGRDTLISLPGLALTTKRFDVARGLLKTFGQYCQQGLIPNAFPDVGAKPFYNSLDASLWWIETLGLYLEASQDSDFLIEQYPIVRRIYKGLMAGTLYSIRVDAFDGLVTWDAAGVALTWMDVVVEGYPVTPRRGKAIEINALWYSALCWMHKWAERLKLQPQQDQTRLENEARRYAQQIEQVQSSLRKFWNPTQRYFYDTIAPDDRPDPSVRPNAIVALSLHHCGFSIDQGQQALQTAQFQLLTPYGLRSLSPFDPQYVGQYAGGIWQRDRAYHQGTVWSWLLGPFIRGWRRFYGTVPLPIDWQPVLVHLQEQACLGSVSEIFDGDAPHLPQGAIAQAWSVAELIRHWDEIAPFVKLPDDPDE